MRLTPGALFGRRPLTGAVPSQVKLAPGGGVASFLRPAADDRNRLQLWLASTADGDPAPPWRLLDGSESSGEDGAAETDEAKAERERRRLFARGVSAYAWHPQGNAIFFPADGGVFAAQTPHPFTASAEAAVRRLTPAASQQSGLCMSPAGTFLSFVRDGDLYCLRVSDGVETRLTHDAGGTVTNGLAEFIAQEEMHRFEGHWWAPDERSVAFARVDVAPIAETRRYEIRAAGIDVVTQRYPFAGTANAEVRLGLHDIASGTVRWLDWALAGDDYLARVAFAPDGALFVAAQSRDQRRLALRRYHCGRWQDVLAEESPTWVNLHDNLTFLADGRLLWTSERSGHAQLYVVRQDGGDMRVAAGNLGRVNRVLGATNETAWVTGWQRDPTTQHLFRIDLRRAVGYPITTGDAWHDGAVDATGGVGAVVRSDAESPGTLQIVDLHGDRTRRTVLSGNVADAAHPYFSYRACHAPSTFGQLGEGGDALHYRLTLPQPFVPGDRYPVIVHVYGGPGVQRVRRDFPPLALQLFAQAGYGVFELDNRGGANRSKAFEDVLHGRLGDVEVQDQLAGVAFLHTLPWVDAQRIGVFGHSYGGYMALLCLAAGDAFAAGVSVAPVTRWELYDTHYTERYLGTPADNPEGYAASAALPRAGEIRAPLLLMHGMADDNVLFAHSTALMKALQDAGVQFQLMTYPGAKHALQDTSVAIHRYRCILEFLDRALQRGQG